MVLSKNIWRGIAAGFATLTFTVGGLGVKLFEDNKKLVANQVIGACKTVKGGLLTVTRDEATTALNAMKGEKPSLLSNNTAGTIASCLKKPLAFGDTVVTNKNTWYSSIIDSNVPSNVDPKSSRHTIIRTDTGQFDTYSLTAPGDNMTTVSVIYKEKQPIPMPHSIYKGRVVI